MIRPQTQGIGIPDGGRNRHGRVSMPDKIRLKLFKGHDLALGIQSKETHILIRTYFKTEQLGMVFLSL
jgi:hypothetical protein